MEPASVIGMTKFDPGGLLTIFESLSRNPPGEEDSPPRRGRICRTVLLPCQRWDEAVRPAMVCATQDCFETAASVSALLGQRRAKSSLGDVVPLIFGGIGTVRRIFLGAMMQLTAWMTVGGNPHPLQPVPTAAQMPLYHARLLSPDPAEASLLLLASYSAAPAPPPSSV